MNVQEWDRDKMARPMRKIVEHLEDICVHLHNLNLPENQKERIWTLLNDLSVILYASKSLQDSI